MTKEKFRRAPTAFFLLVILALVGVAAMLLFRQRAVFRPFTEANAGINVVVVVVDTLRADRVDAQRNGAPVMPRLRKLSEKGLRFTRATSQASWTKPSVVSLFTSLYPEVHDVRYGLTVKLFENQDRTVDTIPEDIETMGLFFKDAGYGTAAIQTNANLKRIGVEKGVDRWFFSAYPKLRAYEVTQMAKEFLSLLTPPFFLYVHYMDPHQPYDPPEAHRRVFGAAPEITEADRALVKNYSDYYHRRHLSEQGLAESSPYGRLSEAGREYFRYLYDGEAHYVDEQVSHLIDEIQATHSNTLIVLTADHGEELWDHGEVGHGRTLYQELINVPLIIWGPGVRARVAELRVEVIDILPTLAFLAGLAPRPFWQGRLLPLFAPEKEYEDRAVFSETTTSLRESHLHIESVILNDTKLIRDVRLGTAKIFDLRTDPLEQSGSTRPSERARQLADVMKSHGASNRSHAFFDIPASNMALDKETSEELEALGYLGPP